ncbi:cupredoxin domain-containing protein [Dictyobacter formicarum]|uniref:EfeO-type cupredoxin-like domain-containing protein n=1 Tax=Dictyobacter formicarum TaxID=2778368 RepID=A0ABQ3VHP1_9CHLR|nr:cupredoxin domain-containing protein [Dictyobacter formicarum]GHO84986.1 hypothetical protein KSZ_29920 [Dictyobacter formicarum]
MVLFFQRHLCSFRALIGILVVATVLLMTACDRSGSSSSGSGGSSTQPTATPTSTMAASKTPAKVVQVKIVEKDDKYSFDPASITIPKGAQVVWTNTSDAPHTVTSDKNAFTASSNLTQNQTFMMTFNTAGTYAYHCSIHSYMKATITVTS